MKRHIFHFCTLAYVKWLYSHRPIFIQHNLEYINVSRYTNSVTSTISAAFCVLPNWQRFFNPNIIKDADKYDGIKIVGTIYDDATKYESSDIVIRNNIISGCERDGIDCASDMDRITITGNTIKNCDLNGIEVKLLDGAT